MKAITVEPHKPESACLEDIPAPDVHDGSVLVEAVAVGVCGTDVEIVSKACEQVQAVGQRAFWEPNRPSLSHPGVGRAQSGPSTRPG